MTLAAKLCKAELAYYDKFWDSVQSEATLLEDRFERGMAAGEAKGRAEGLAEGILEGKRITAHQLLAMGMSVEQVCLVTGLEMSDIRS